MGDIWNGVVVIGALALLGGLFLRHIKLGKAASYCFGVAFLCALAYGLFVAFW